MEIGDYRVEIIPDCVFKLDGGAMFGVVPRVLWERVCPPDDRNRISLTCNCLFIDTGREKLLVETGMGEKWSEKESAMYGIERSATFAHSLWEIAGCGPEDIDIVVNTHLHFDHAGGNTLPGPEGVRPAFPNARYFVSAAEMAHAESPHERDRVSYLPANWRPLAENGQLELMPERYEAVPGLVVEQVRGHSETMQTVRLDRGGTTLFGFFDMVPTSSHVPLPWIMGYDLLPAETLGFKKRALPMAAEQKWICHFYHDIEMPLGMIVERDGKLNAEPYGC
jgi:glyoxylase-like metal-dependent hydrolase (beta-lactamase superfamily II)